MIGLGQFGVLDVFLRKSVFTYHVGKTLEVENVRLGVCSMFLNFLAFVVVLCYGLGTSLWWSAVEPVGFGLDIWRLGEADAVAAARMDVLHCRDPQSYWHQSPDQVYRPARCRKMQPNEAYIAGDRSQLLFPTNVRDTSTWLGEGQACNAARHWCTGRAADAHANYSVSGTACSCTWTDEFLVMNPEEEHIAFHHGFEANLGGSERPRVVVRAGTGLESVFMGPLDDMKRQLGSGLLTVILKADRSRCTVGGRAAWSADAAAGGISGSIKEWLACADVTLDSDPQSVVPSQVKLPRHLRTVGIAMQLVLEYTNVHSEPNHDGVVCFVTVEVEPLSAAASLERKDIVQLPLPPQNQTAWRTRASRVVAVSLKAGGSYRYFNLGAAPQVLVNMLVLLQLPALVLSFIVLRCLGRQSQVYRNARKSRLDPFQQFLSAISRSMVAEAGFRSTLGGTWEGGMAELDGLSPQRLFHHLRDVCRDELKSGAMKEAELQQVALATVHQLGTTETGTVSCAQFVRACMANESVNLQDVARVVAEYSRFSHEGIKEAQLDDPESALASSTAFSSQRKKWEAEIAQRLTLLEECLVHHYAPAKTHGIASENCNAMGLLGLLQSRIQDKLGPASGQHSETVATLQKEVLSLQDQLHRTEERLKNVELQTCASTTKDRTADASQLPSGVPKNLHQEILELRQDWERRFRALEHHLRISPVQESLVKQNPFMSSRNVSRLPLDALGNNKLQDEPSKANPAGPGGTTSACSTARGTVTTAVSDLQSRLESLTRTTDSDVQSSTMTVRGKEGYETGHILSDAEDEKAEGCQGILTDQGLDHVQVWYPFEPLGDVPKVPEAPAAVMLKENQRKAPTALPPLSLSSNFQVADFRSRLQKASHTVPAVPVPPTQPSFHDPGQSAPAPARSLVPPIPVTKQRTPYEPSKLETPKGSPRESTKSSPRESDLLKRRPDFGKVEMGIECRRYLPPSAGKVRSQSQPAAERASGGTSAAVLTATSSGTGKSRT